MCFLSNRFRGARASFHHFILFLTNFIPIGSSSSRSQQWHYCWEHCVVPSITQTPHPQTQPEPAASIFSYLWSCCKTPTPFKVLLFKGNYLHSMLLRFFFKLFPYLALWGFSCIIWDLSTQLLDLFALSHVGSLFPGQGSNLCPCIARLILNHWNTREIPDLKILKACSFMFENSS